MFHREIPWRVPENLFAGELVFVLGGGPSLAGFDASVLRGRRRVVAINVAGWRLAPWADMFYFADLRFVRSVEDGGYGFGARLSELGDGPVVTRCENFASWVSRPVLKLGHEKRAALSRDPGKVAGFCSGANAINLAFLGGAAEIVLLGFDMRASGNFHADYPRAAGEATYAERLRPALARMAAELAREPVRVVNATPGTALECFPVVELGGVLGASAIVSRQSAVG